VASGDAPSLILWEGADVVGVAPIYASSDNLIGVVRADLNSAADLKGKKIAVRKGSTADYFLTTYLTSNGVKPSEVSILNLSPPETVPSLANGSIDGFFLWQPYPSLAKKVLGGKSRELTTARGYYLEQIYLTANRKFAEANPATVTKVLRALKRSVDFVKADPQKSAAIVARKIKTEPDVVATLIATKPYSMQYGVENRDQMVKLVTFLRDNDKIKTPIDIDKAFDRRYLRALDPSLVTDR
jgi:ABC-type nitrate/sulfonate/bicarbonate transport system substrate-binding protein